jgi:histidinol-phosphatase
MEMAARRAEAVMLASKGEKQEIWFKPDAHIVTRGDMDAERALIETFQQAYPDFDFSSEEWGDQRRGANATWLIDPIDGTANFVGLDALSVVHSSFYSSHHF